MWYINVIRVWLLNPIVFTTMIPQAIQSIATAFHKKGRIEKEVKR